MAFYSWNDLNQGIDMGVQVAREAKKFACRLWNDYPDQWTDGTAFGSPIRQFWNSLCYEPPEPPLEPPPPTFTGGQCPIKYTVQTSIAVFPSTVNCNRNPDSISNFSQTLWGPIGGFNLIEPTGNCGGKKTFTITCHGTAAGSSPRLINPVNLTISTFSYGRFLEIVSTSITPVAGQPPDNCGNLPTNYPPTIPPEPGDETYNVNFEGDENNNFSFPLIWNDIDFEIPLKFNFDVGDVAFNFDGIEINFKENNEWKINPPKKTDNGDNVFTYNPPDDYTSEDSPTETEEEKEESDDETIDLVLIEVTEPPLFGTQKVITQNNPEDTTFFAGYFSWKYDDYRHAEIPIRKKKNVFKNNIGANGYRFYAVNGAKLKYTVLKKVD